jgi:hypothetical protein
VTDFETAIQNTLRRDAEQRAAELVAERAELGLAPRRARRAKKSRTIVDLRLTTVDDYDGCVALIAERSGTTIEQVWGFFSFDARLPQPDQMAISRIVIELGLNNRKSRAVRTLMILADERHENGC